MIGSSEQAEQGPTRRRVAFEADGFPVPMAPASLCPEVLGLAEPGQVPDARGRIYVHPVTYVSRSDADLIYRYQNPIPATRGWTSCITDENFPGWETVDLLPFVRLGVVTRTGLQRPVWIDETVIGVLIGPYGATLDRGQIDHPKKALRTTPVQAILTDSWLRGLRGSGGLVLLVRRLPVDHGLALHRLARTVRRESAKTPSNEAHLLLNLYDSELEQPDFDLYAPPEIPPPYGRSQGPLIDADLALAANGAGGGAVARLVELTEHRSGAALVLRPWHGPAAAEIAGTLAAHDLDVEVADHVASNSGRVLGPTRGVTVFRTALQLSVRRDLLASDASVEALARVLAGVLCIPLGEEPEPDLSLLPGTLVTLRFRDGLPHLEPVGTDRGR